MNKVETNCAEERKVKLIEIPTERRQPVGSYLFTKRDGVEIETAEDESGMKSERDRLNRDYAHTNPAPSPLRHACLLVSLLFLGPS